MRKLTLPHMSDFLPGIFFHPFTTYIFTFCQLNPNWSSWELGGGGEVTIVPNYLWRKSFCCCPCFWRQMKSQWTGGINIGDGSWTEFHVSWPSVEFLDPLLIILNWTDTADETFQCGYFTQYHGHLCNAICCSEIRMLSSWSAFHVLQEMDIRSNHYSGKI